jgi:two-component system, response regulator YesN
MYRVLLVDDEVLVREAVSENIRWNELGYELAGNCQNGKEAIDFLEKNSVDVVLTDICMPFVDGMQLSEFIYKSYNQINIIIFSGYDDFEYAKKAIKYNVEEYLLKPVTAFELSEVLTNLKGKMDKKKEEANKIGKLNEAYYKNKLFIKSKVLEDLIRGNKTAEESNKDLLEHNIVLDATYYRVAIVEIDLCSEMYKTDEYRRQQSSLMTFAVYNISDEILEQYQAGHASIGNDNRVSVLFQTNKPKTFELEIKSICKKLNCNIMKYMKIGTTIGIGRYVTCLEDIHKSYQEAEDSLEYQYLFGESSIIDMEDILQIRMLQKDDLLLEDKIDPLILAIKMNDKHGIDDVLTKIQDAIKYSFADKNRSDLYLQQIMISVNKTLKDSELDKSNLYLMRNQLISAIAKAKTLCNVMEMIKKNCYQVADELVMQKNIGGKKQALLAKDYIEKNYADAELNLNSICSYLSISASRFSTIFKHITGETFMEALTRIRMQKAKELLENTDLKNYEIAEKVGFSDPHYFSIAFKKMTGKTPSDYAKEKR